MFEREIKFIYDFNLNRINKIGSYLTFEQLSSLDIHPAILKYISAEIDFLIFEDRQKLLQDSVFNYSGEKINGYFNLIGTEIKKSKKLSIEYIEKLLLHAISFIANYLVRPRWTLSRFLFDKDESKSTAEVKQIINYVYFYNYLTDTLISYLDKKNLVSVTQNDVDELIKKIDDFTLESYLPNIIESALNSMSEFFNIGTVQQNKISINAVKLFLQEKNLDDHIKKLEDTFAQDEKTKHSTSDILNALSSGELMFNLKSMETEQIDEDELENKESLEFETVEEELNSDNNDFPENLADDNDEIKPDDESTAVYEDETNSEFNGGDIETAGNEIPESGLPISETELNVSENDIDETNEESFPENEMTEETESGTEKPNNESESLAETQNEEDSELAEISSDTEMISPDEKFAFEEVEGNDVNTTEDESESQINPEDKLLINKDETQEVTNEDAISETVREEEEITDRFENANLETETLEAEISEPSEDEIEEFEEEEKTQSTENYKFEETGAEDATPETMTEEEEIIDQFENENLATETLEAEISEPGEDEIEEFEEEEKIPSTENYEFEETGTKSEKHENEEIYSEEVLGTNDTPDLSSEDISPEEVEIDEEIQPENISEIIDEMESDVLAENGNDVEEEIVEANNEDTEQDFNEVEQPELFPPEEVDDNNQDNLKLNNLDEEEKIEETASSPQIELSELLENKNMNKILKVVFDYDMDDFVSAIDSIAECKNENEAEKILEKIYDVNGVKPTSKEAKAFNSIISEYFKKI